MSPKDDIIIRRHVAERIFPPQPEWCELSLRCRRSHYSASEIARAVEDCDAHLLNLNVTSRNLAEKPESDSDDVTVDIRVGACNGGSVARSLERYGYDVEQIVDSDTMYALTDTMRDRLELLIKNLEL